MRRFFLENEKGDRWELGKSTGVYVTNPTGLGTALGQNFTDLGHGFFAPVNADAEPQTAVCCDFKIVGPKPYSVFTSFAAWISAAGDELRFGYAPEATEYLRRVKLAYLNKTELEGARWMTCPAAFQPLTPWYRPVPGTQQTETPDDALFLDTAGSVLDVNVLIDSTEAGQNATVPPAGHLPPALVLRYSGALTNPVIRVVGTQSGTEYGRCDLAATIGAEETLVWSTEFNAARVEKITAEGERVSLLDAADLAFDPFPHPSAAEPLRVNLGSDTPISRAAAVTAYYYYRTV